MAPHPKYPEMAAIKQGLFNSDLYGIENAVAATLSDLSLQHCSRPGDTVAIGVGSRGIHRLDTVVRQCVRFLQDCGLKPFIVPAMGSHGGATADGQKNVLEKLGITESVTGAPIHPEMDAACIGTIPDEINVYMARAALAADHIVVINRIKPHTKFQADIESGLCKMLAIGLGKESGASELHRSAVSQSFQIIERASELILKNCHVLFGLALLEDACGHLSHVEAVPAAAIIEREKALLKRAYTHMGQIPFDLIDILVIDQIGKDISGIGMDSNVTGRHRDITGDFQVYPHVKRIFVRDLSPASDGNGNGIGLADVTTKRLVDAMDLEKTYVNALAAISPEKAALPIYFPTDQMALDACIRTIGPYEPETARIVRIQNTASLEVLQVSRGLEREIAANHKLKQISPWEPAQFDKEGNFIDFQAPSVQVR